MNQNHGAKSVSNSAKYAEQRRQYRAILALAEAARRYGLHGTATQHERYAERLARQFLLTKPHMVSTQPSAAHLADIERRRGKMHVVGGDA